LTTTKAEKDTEKGRDKHAHYLHSNK